MRQRCERPTELLLQALVDRPLSRYRLVIRESVIHGYGVFAAEAIPRRRKVLEYTGERINRREVYHRARGRISYLFALDRYWTLDGSVGGSGAEYVNHSCNPNLHVTIARGHVLFMSARKIEIGEEITIDYRFSRDEVTVPCRCGSLGCRGTINVK